MSKIVSRIPCELRVNGLSEVEVISKDGKFLGVVDMDIYEFNNSQDEWFFGTEQEVKDRLGKENK